MDELELKQRTKRFGLPVMKLVGSLPDDSVGHAIGSQLIRSGTSVGANYRAACRGRSLPEFIAKLGVVVEEADESGYWLTRNENRSHRPLIFPIANGSTNLQSKIKIPKC